MKSLKKSAEINDQLTRSGQTMSLANATTAATAVTHNLQFITRET